MNTPRKRAPTIRDVAQAAGVSTATVSKFVNGSQRFSIEVEARISQAVIQLGWSLNPMARGMNTGLTGNVGIVLQDIRNPHFTSMVKGAARAAAKVQMNLIVADAAESREPELAVVKALSRRVDGLIVSARLPQPVIQALLDGSTPVVFYGGPSPDDSHHSVCCDNYQAGRILGRHLSDRGYRRISYIGFPTAAWSEERWQGLQEAFQGQDAHFTQFEAAAPVSDEGERLASVVMLSGEMPDAIVAFNDLLALGLLAEARALGVRVPEQVAIAGFDNIAYGRFCNPMLTSVDMMSEAVGEQAMRRLVQAIQGVGSTDVDVLTSRLVVRESTNLRR
ncbi:LacI family DNA-binding transcriptional regulator [Acidovorax sp. CCYZU-2555]|uniref:LacI family DNA-binding transcriptional regulator n=1 Tax=Acidovorax sp. CCYZU-2555 TaxID=2835042 RepID=UPI001BCC4C3B|nr:LacI family DNA-binding transcriptional regulator [Acidovorax sp. CCYZU-2555]MBS7780297.1 LacI family DNA-binding transcriptional regulator [Acidovorax sp. CCYZU-2555]